MVPFFDKDFTDINNSSRRIAAPVNKIPLFREASPTPSISSDDEGEDVKPIITPPKAKKTIPVKPVYEEDNGINSDDELAAALLTKAVISPSSKSKGKARAITPPTASNDIAPPPPQPPTSTAPTSTTTSLPLVSVTGQLHLFDRETALFMLQEEVVKSTIHRTSEGYWLLVEGEKGIWVSQGVEKDMVINFSEVSYRRTSFLFSNNTANQLLSSLERISNGIQF